MPLTVDTMDGEPVQVAAGTNQRTGDTKCYRIVFLLPELQKYGAVGMQTLRVDDAEKTTVITWVLQNKNHSDANLVSTRMKFMG